MATTGNIRIANPIAVRRLSVVDDPEKEIMITLGKPRRSNKVDAWACSFVVEGLPNARRRVAHGVDSLQALQVAVEAARRTLDASGWAFRWNGGFPGEIGLPRAIPSFEGSGFAERMEQYVDREHKRFLRAAKGRGEPP